MIAKQQGRPMRPIVNVLVGIGLAGSMLGVSLPAWAGDYQVYSPNVVKGEKEIELRGFNSWGTDAHTGAGKAARFAVAYSPTDFWATELYANAEQEPGESLKLEEYEWENRFQLTPQGKYWADLGIISEIEIPRFSHDPYEVKVGPMIEKDFGRLTTQVNLLAAHQYGKNAESGVELSYRARLLYRADRLLSPVVEAYGQPVGKIGDWGHPRNQIGGGLSGKAVLGGGKNLVYSAVVLFGTSRSAADTTAVARLEYEFF